MAYKVAIILEVSFKFDLEHVARDIEKIKKMMGPRAHFPVAHSAKSLKFIVVTTEMPEALRERLSPRLLEINAVDNCWFYMAPRLVFGLHGDIDPFGSRIAEAWKIAEGLNHPKHLKKA